MLNRTLWVGFILRFSVAFWNGFFGPSFEADKDALGFHLRAVEYSKNFIFDEFVTGHIYSYALGAFYFVTTDSLFLGSLLSVAAWVVSALILIRIMCILSFQPKIQVNAILIYSLLPSSIFITSVTLREVYQLLFVNMAIYSALKLYLHRTIVQWFVLGGAVAGMGVLHGALLASGIFIIVGTLTLLMFRSKNKLLLVKMVFFIPAIFVCGYLGLAVFTSISYGLQGGLGAAVQVYQEGTIAAEGRAIYRSDVLIESFGNLLLSVPLFLLQYLFEPMPWRMSAWVDMVSFFENCLRAWLIWRVILSIHNSTGQRRRLLLFIFAVYIAMEILWSLGVSNWGTALRHHIPSIGLLLTAAFAYSGHSNKCGI